MSFIYNMTDTWNDGSTVFTAVKMNVTNTASASGSKLMDLQVSGTSQFNVDSSGNVGVGISVPISRLDVRGPNVADGSNTGIVTVYSTSAQSANVGGRIDFGGLYDGSNYLSFAGLAGRKENSTSGDWSGYLQFSTRLYGGGFVERARIDSSGNLLVGTSAAGSWNANCWGTQGPFTVTGHVNGTASGIAFSYFDYNNGVIGSITQNGTTGVLYNITSDRRLKENIAPAPDAGDKIDAIEIVSYDWKSAPDESVEYGVIAQDLVAVVPQAVKVGDDGDEIEDTWGIDYSQIVPLLIKEVQNLRARVAQLEAN